MGSIDAPVTNVALPPIVANDPSTAEVTPGVSPAGAVTKPGSSGSARARSLRETLRSTGGFSTAIQTAELLDLPVGLRPSTR